MADAQDDLLQLRSREWEADLLDYRGWRVNGMRAWKNRIRVADLLYSGRWSEVFPDETVMTENPHVMNMVQTAMDDIAKLVSEASPATKCPPTDDGEPARAKAHIREVIAETYWDINDGDILTPLLGQDLVGTGGAFLVGSYDPSEKYPCIYRVDPRYAYPDIRNGKLVDLLVIESLNYRIAAKMFPQAGLSTDDKMRDKSVEIVHYYKPGLAIQGVAYSTTGGTPNAMAIVNRWEPKNVKGEPILPVAWAQMGAFDGQFRGIFDQIGGSLQTKNRIIKQLLDYTDEIVYAERYSKGLLNPDEPPGPMAHFRLDPTVTDAIIGRVPPAASAPQVFQMVEYLDREQRGSVGYPAARQGEISQSIASATFVASTQGQLTTLTRYVQGRIAKMRAQLNKVMFQIDEAYCDDRKPLMRAYEGKQTYKPGVDIKGEYQNFVQYGAASGLDRISADNRVLQLLGANVISREKAREEIDFIDDPRGQEEQIELEATQGALVQKLLSDAPPEMLLKLVADQSDGMSLAESAKSILAQQQAAQQQQGQPGQPPAEEAAEGAQLPGQAAGAPAQPGLAEPGSVFAPPPVDQIQVQPPRPGRPVQFR